MPSRMKITSDISMWAFMAHLNLHMRVRIYHWSLLLFYSNGCGQAVYSDLSFSCPMTIRWHPQRSGSWPRYITQISIDLEEFAWMFWKVIDPTFILLLCWFLFTNSYVDNWSPALQIRTILLSIQALLGAPNPDDPLANDVAQRWKEDEQAAIITAKEWTRTHAMT